MRRSFLLAALPVSLISGAVFLVTSPTHAMTRTSADYGRTHCPGDGVAATSSFSPPNPQVTPYLLDDPRLGPRYLPRRGPIGDMLEDYIRFDATGPRQFLSCFWETEPFMNWRYPKDNGFLVIHGHPVEHMVTLRRGQEIDQFGNPGNPANLTAPAPNGGQFLSPAGTPYEDRAIPPSNLDTYPGSTPFSYHLYLVLKKFSVLAGPAAPWFDQPGRGIQYYLADTTDPGLPPDPGIANLVNQGYVQEVPVRAASDFSPDAWLRLEHLAGF